MEIITKNNVAVIITTHNDYEKTFNCLQSLHKQTDIPARIVVVDNGSENMFPETLLTLWKSFTQNNNLPEPIEVFSEQLPSAPFILLRLSENEGYPCAINSAIKMLLYDKNCKAFWFLHNDTISEQFTLSALLRHTFEEESKEQIPYHIIGSTVIYADRDDIMCTGGGTFSSILGKVRLTEEGVSRHSLPDRIPTIKNLDFIYGASLLIRRDVFEKIGLFKESFFLFFEDVEFSIRAKKAGFRLNWAPGAIIKHIGPVPGRATPVRTFNQMTVNEKELPQLADYYNIRNRFYLLKTLHPYTFFLSLLTLPLPLSIRWFKGQKSRFNNVLKAAYDGITKI